MTTAPAITVHDLYALRAANEPHFLLDVREENEATVCTLGGHLMPMQTVPDNIASLPRNIPLVVHCRSGGRSGKIVEFLHANGFDNAVNLAGGILAWADHIDPSLAKY